MDCMKRSPAIFFCVIFIFVTCFFELKALVNAQWYWHMFQYLPQDQIAVRYIISLSGRILLLIAAVGIFQLKDWGRILGIILFAANLVSLPWKHPELAIANSLTYQPIPILDALLQELNSQNINFISLVEKILTVWDLVLNAGLLFFFTRKNVKKQFNSKISLQP